MASDVSMYRRNPAFPGRPRLTDFVPREVIWRYQKALREWRRSHGLCTNCESPVDGEHATCSVCLEKNRLSNARSRAKKKRDAVCGGDGERV